VESAKALSILVCLFVHLACHIYAKIVKLITEKFFLATVLTAKNFFFHYTLQFAPI